MTLLQDLAIDVLNHITSYLHGPSIVRLLACGSTPLKLKLCEGGGVHHLRFVVRSSKPVRWSSVINWMPSLVDFSYIREKCNSDDAPLRFEKLSRTLQSIDCSDLNSARDFFTALNNHPDLFPALQSLQLRSCKLSEYVAVKSWPSRLTHLNVSLGRGVLDPSLLPPSLTNARIICSSVASSAFPHSLTSLAIKANEVDGDHVFALDLLPRELGELTLDATISWIDTHQWEWEGIPPQLTKLNIRSRNVSESLLHALPPCLTHLSLGYSGCNPLHGDLLHLLPSGLKVLEGLSAQFVDAPRAAALPRSLIRLGPSKWKANSHRFLHTSLPHVPPNLEVINADTEWNLRPEQLECHELPIAPSTMILHQPSLDFIEILPTTSLTALIITQPVSIDIIDRLPKSTLQHLHICTSQPLRFSRFPSSLTDLHWHCHEINIELTSTIGLSPNLRVLTVGDATSCVSISSADWFTHLPATITKMKLFLYVIPDEETWDDVYLPPHLRKFSIAVSSPSAIQTWEPVIKRIPASITCLELRSEPTTASLITLSKAQLKLLSNTQLTHFKLEPLQLFLSDVMSVIPSLRYYMGASTSLLEDEL